ncbi:photosystem II repair protein Psb32 [[Phormidium] sp. ETS-05]|uniref:photosystem II repair protein Psb32 n=1 Tax=[Phormidium] sp. ETS-05 TaxID=222819 RepID=UPI0018EF2F6C|nr:TPM domain-containing protein [[Phormidium] sp. ETS-05]
MRQIFNQITQWRSWLVMPFAALWLVAGLVVAGPALATAVYELPPLRAGEPTWVVDKAEVLSRLNEGSISSKLEKLQQETGYEVRLVTIHRLDYGDTAQTYTDKVFETWFPTPEAQANQVLLILDNVTNDAGIRTGALVKSLLTDEIAESVVSETVQVPLRQGDKYNQALLDASDRLITVLSGEPDPGPPVVTSTIQVEGTFKSAEETDTVNSAIIVVVLLVLATAIPMVTWWWYQSQ